MQAESTVSAFMQLLPSIQRHLVKMGLNEFSDIQNIAIPLILRGDNVLLIAPTGTGKTLAAVLPILHMFLHRRAVGEVRGISILYVTPLRALNRDILRRMLELGKELDVKVQVRHGDTPTSTRAMQAKNPPNMLITTPETLQAILPGKRMKEHLKDVRWVVVDEIHELATDERGAQLSLALERLQHLTGRAFQRIGLSATVGEENKVANFLGGTNRLVTIAKSTESKQLDIRVDYVSPTASDKRVADKFGLPAATVARAKLIAKLITGAQSTLVFTNTREHAEAISSQLHALRPRLRICVHHGSLSREIREEAERDFQRGKAKGMICTSSLELGIDIGKVDLIVQYTSPREVTHLVQRIGRSGHSLHGMARGVIIGTTADDVLESAVIADSAKQGGLEKTVVHEKALDILAHQIVGIVLGQGRTTVPEIHEIIKGAYPFRDITTDELTSVIKFMASLHTIRFFSDTNTVASRFPNSFNYYYKNLSAIPDVKRFDVFDFFRKRKIGTLDQGFVARRCKAIERTVFIMHGQTWKIVSIDEEKFKIEVEPTAPTLDAIPSWEGEMIPVSFDAAQAVGQLRGFIANNLRDAESLTYAAEKLQVSRAAMKKIVETVKAHVKDFPLPTDKCIIIEKFEHCIIIHACFGNFVNESLAMVLSSILGSRYDMRVATQVDAYRIVLMSTFKADPELVALEISKFTPEAFETVLRESVEASELFAWRNWQVGKRFGVVEKEANYGSRLGQVLVRAYQGTPLNQEAHREILIEKLDLETVKNVIRKIQTGEITVEVVGKVGPSCSPYATPIVERIISHDLLRPATTNKPLVEIIKERLYGSKVRLMCTFNCDWDTISFVGTLPDKIRCPVCGSTLVAATFLSNDSLSTIALRRKRGATLSDEEKQVWDQGTRSASLVQTYGKRAIVVMAGRGVGPATAVRVLRKFHRTEDDLYVDILKAEREYARTRLFWD